MFEWKPTNAPVASSRTDDVWFVDANMGWAVNSNGQIIHTTDGGEHWTEQLHLPVYWRCIMFVSPTRGWAGTITDGNILYDTHDGGATWRQVTNLPPEPPVAVCGLWAVNESVVYMAGSNVPQSPVRMMKTTDGGQTWTARDMRPWADNLIDVYFPTPERGWIVGGKADDPMPTKNNLKPVVLYTEDGGETWVNRVQPIHEQFPPGEWGWKIQFLSEQIGFISLQNYDAGAILVTRDGGLTWERRAINDPQGNANLEGIGFLDEQHGWVGGWGDRLKHKLTSSETLDGGLTWRDANEIGNTINRFRFIGSPLQVGYSAGKTVYKYSEQAISPQLAEMTGQHLASGVFGSDDPMADESHVEVAVRIPEGVGRLTIRVWDQFGTFARVLVDEARPTPGRRIVHWDGSDEAGRPCPDGSFIWRATTDDRSESRIVRFVRARTASCPGFSPPSAVNTFMPTPEFQWIRYRVAPTELHGLRALTLAAAPTEGEAAMEMELPDLRPWPTPQQKVEVLLHVAAEIEHMLLVEYLYSSFSVRGATGLEPETDAIRLAALSSWGRTLFSIAKQEMGHLMTVQNLLLFTRLTPSLVREEMPPQKQFYPFPLHLEPLTQRSLAKYVIAESPPHAAGLEDIIALATGAAGQAINHVGVLYSLLGVVLTGPGELESNAQTLGGWYEIVRDVGLLAYQQQPAEAWHLADGDFDPASVGQQAGEEWSNDDAGIRVHTVADRAAALDALRDISVQGEGPGTDGSSHFEMFLAAFRGGGAMGLPPFPATGDAWVPARSVPVDPRVPATGAPPAPNDITQPQSQLLARSANVRYALLLGYIEHHLLATTAADRSFLTDQAFGEMHRLAGFARNLSKLPQRADGTGVASMPFTLPPADEMPLPAGEKQRWTLHQRRLQQAVELNTLTGNDALKATDEATLARVQAHVDAA